MIGKQVQNYEIKEHLGEGGMGTVFRASDSILSRDVALKMLHTPLLQQPLFLERFKKEARVLAQLLHPNIAVIYNMIEQDNNHFMVMEYVEGKNIDALVRQYKSLSYKVVVPVIIQALEGLGHAHRKGIYHRDIKPSNLILKSDGTVKLMDFGIAMVAGEQRLTQVNRVVGTVEYIAPEIIQGKEPSIATDLYAMGVTMYEMLTGMLPFEGNSDYNLMQDILKKKPLAIDKLNASVPRALNDIVMKTLEKRPTDRFADARVLQQALLNAFPDLRNAELTESYIKTAQAQMSAPAAATRKVAVTPQATQILGGNAAVGSFGFFDKAKEKIMARENRLMVICGSVVLLTAVMAFIFMPRGATNNKTGTSATVQPDQTKNDNNPKTNTDNPNIVPVKTQPNNPIVNPTPLVTPDEPKKETPKKKKDNSGNEDEKKPGKKDDGGEEAKGDKGENADNGDKGSSNNNNNNKSDNKNDGDKGDDNSGGGAKKDDGDKDNKEKKDRNPFEELFGKKKKDQTDKSTPDKKLKFSFKKNG